MARAPVGCGVCLCVYFILLCDCGRLQNVSSCISGLWRETEGKVVQRACVWVVGGGGAVGVGRVHP